MKTILIHQMAAISKVCTKLTNTVYGNVYLKMIHALTKKRQSHIVPLKDLLIS